MWGDAEVARYIGGTPSTRGEAWGRLHRYVGHWALLDYGYWTVRERASDRFVGEVGFADFRRGLGPAFDDHPECGWALAPWAQGNGFATEAILGALDWAVLNLQADRTVCMIHPDNQASFKVAAKCGFRPFAESTIKGAPTVLCERGLSA